MANIKKSFNFRNGVQVDDDNLKVSGTGLVGIGTTVPTEALDVRGNIVISGVSSSTTLKAGVATITTLNPTEIIGAGVSIKSGIVTASSGIITFFGDARFLQGMPTSQWEDVNTGLGVTSIYNTGGNVGIATSNPQFTLQIGNNVNLSQNGVGISSSGDIKATGIATASGFVGPLTGDVTGNVTGNLTGNVTGNITGSTLTGNVTGNLIGLVNSAGISTFAGINATGRIVGAAVSNVIPFFYSNFSDLPSAVTYHGAFAHVHSTGKGYYAHGGAWIELVNKNTSGNVDLEKDLDVDGHTNLDNVNIAGVTTFAGAIDANGGANIDNVQIGVTNNNEIDTSTGNLTIDSDGGTTTIDDDLSVTGQITSPFIESTGAIKATSRLESQLIGVGTDNPANFIQVRQNGDTEIQVTSDTGTAGITVGREPAVANTNNAEFRYGGGAGFPYSSVQSLDILNYGTGNFNYYLSANNPGGVQGDFHWHKGSNNVRLMTLTNTGRLGIGITQPTDELDVVGGVTVSGNVAVGNNITVSGTVIGNLQGTVTGNVSGTLAGNANATVGISTLNNLSVAGIATADRIRANKFSVGENPNLDLVSIFISNTNKVFVNDVGQVGISTTIALSGVGVNGSSTNAVFSAIGIGVTQLASAAVDLRNAGDATSRYMIPPKVSGTGGLQNLVSGAMVYNTSINKLQVYNGSSWETITSS